MRSGIPYLAVLCSAALFTLGAPLPARAAEKEDLVDRLHNSRDVYQELITAADRSVPEGLRNDCKCVGVFPHVIKAAIGIGGRHGKGVVSCRDTAGKWSPPAFFTLSGGSWGLQIGAEATDLVLFFMNDKSMQSLLKSKFTLGGKGTVAAGPFGRSGEADTDLHLNAEIYSYAKSKGLFAGLSLEGAKLAPDNDSNRIFYGDNANARSLIYRGVRTVPAAAEEFTAGLK